MRYTLRQPAHAAGAACAGLALLLGACAPITPFARPTPTPTASSPTPTPTPSSPTPGPTPTPSTSLPPCSGQIVTIDETGQFQPFGSGRPPSYVLTAVRMEDGIMKASLSGGYSAKDVPDGHFTTTLIQGEPFYAPTLEHSRYSTAPQPPAWTSTDPPHSASKKNPATPAHPETP